MRIGPYEIKPGVNLSGTNLARAYLSGINLSGAVLKETCLSEANLGSANLSQTDLTAAQFLDKANLTGTYLIGASFNQATTWPAGFTPPSEAIKVE